MFVNFKMLQRGLKIKPSHISSMFDLENSTFIKGIFPSINFVTMIFCVVIPNFEFVWIGLVFDFDQQKAPYNHFLTLSCKRDE